VCLPIHLKFSPDAIRPRRPSTCTESQSPCFERQSAIASLKALEKQQAAQTLLIMSLNRQGSSWFLLTSLREEIDHAPEM
jgi:hypothetical protein